MPTLDNPRAVSKTCSRVSALHGPEITKEFTGIIFYRVQKRGTNSPYDYLA